MGPKKKKHEYVPIVYCYIALIAAVILSILIKINAAGPTPETDPAPADRVSAAGYDTGAGIETIQEEWTGSG